MPRSSTSRSSRGPPRGRLPWIPVDPAGSGPGRPTGGGVARPARRAFGRFHRTWNRDGHRPPCSLADHQRDGPVFDSTHSVDEADLAGIPLRPARPIDRRSCGTSVRRRPSTSSTCSAQHPGGSPTRVWPTSATGRPGGRWRPEPSPNRRPVRAVRARCTSTCRSTNRSSVTSKREASSPRASQTARRGTWSSGRGPGEPPPSTRARVGAGAPSMLRSWRPPSTGSHLPDGCWSWPAKGVVILRSSFHRAGREVGRSWPITQVRPPLDSSHCHHFLRRWIGVRRRRSRTGGACRRRTPCRGIPLAHEPELVIHLGQPWASKLVNSVGNRAAHVLVDPWGRWSDPGRQAVMVNSGDPPGSVRASCPTRPTREGGASRHRQVVRKLPGLPSPGPWGGVRPRAMCHGCRSSP